VNIPKFKQLLDTYKIKEELTILQSEIKENFYLDIKKMTINSIKTNDRLSNICSTIRDLLTEKFKGEWHCIGYKQNYGGYSVRHLKGKFIEFIIADLKFILFQSKK
jgi:hypothetical protein